MNTQSVINWLNANGFTQTAEAITSADEVTYCLVRELRADMVRCEENVYDGYSKIMCGEACDILYAWRL